MWSGTPERCSGPSARQPVGVPLRSPSTTERRSARACAAAGGGDALSASGISSANRSGRWGAAHRRRAAATSERRTAGLRLRVQEPHQSGASGRAARAVGWSGCRPSGRSAPARTDTVTKPRHRPDSRSGPQVRSRRMSCSSTGDQSMPWSRSHTARASPGCGMPVAFSTVKILTQSSSAIRSDCHTGCRAVASVSRRRPAGTVARIAAPAGSCSAEGRRTPR